MKNKGDERAYMFGSLPERGMLGSAYVPMQTSAIPGYEPSEALARGTLFPGLDLPFHNIVNRDVKMTPLTELMALCFAADELGLYLDTHADDKEAFALYQTFLTLSCEAKERYTKLFGPATREDMLTAKSFTWLNDPWPWDYCGDKEE